MDAVVRRVEDLDASTWNDPVRGIIQFRTLIDSAVTSTGTLTAGVAELTEHGWLGLHRHPQAENYHVAEGVGIVW